VPSKGSDKAVFCPGADVSATAPAGGSRGGTNFAARVACGANPDSAKSKTSGPIEKGGMLHRARLAII